MAKRYGQACPVAKSLELVGERWTLLIVRDLIMGAHRFTDLQRGLPGISRSLLSDRLRRLQADGLLEQRQGPSGRAEYWLTPLGLDLQPAVIAVGEWATRNYARDPERGELDAEILMLWIERNARRDAFPRERYVVRFERRSLAAAAGDDVGSEPSVSVERTAWGALRVLTLPLHGSTNSR